VRTLATDPEPGFAGGLKLLDAAGRLVADFADGVRWNTGQGWWACNADLPPGAYILRRGGRNVSLRFQPLYLAAGWQTQAFLLAERYPHLHSLSLSMAPRGAGFRPDDASAIAAEVLLDNLSSEVGAELALGPHVTSLLARKLDNPWFGIVATYALRAARDRLARQGAESPAAQVEATLSYLLTTLAPLRDHPDVAALLLSMDQPAPAPCWSPPLLRVSLRRIHEHATRYAETVPEGSLTDLVLDDVLINSPWTAWHTLASLPASFTGAADGAGPGHGRSLLKVSKQETSLDETLTEYGATLARAAAPSAPVFYLANTARDADWQVASLVPVVLADAGAHATAGDDPRAQVAQAMIRPSPTAAMPDAITVDVEGQVTRLLADTAPAFISTNLDIPLARTERSLSLLLATPAGDAPGDVPTMPGEESLRPIAPAIFDVIVAQTLGPIARDLAGTQPERAKTERPSFIEESVPKLLDESERLLSAANRLPSGAHEYAKHARVAGERLHHLADELLAAAGYTVLTDAQGRIVFGNGAFRIFLTHAADVNGGGGKPMSRAEREQAGQRAWEATLEGMPLGTSTVPVPDVFSHHTGDDWHLQRTEVRDDRSGDLRAYLNLLHNPAGKRITGTTLREIARLLPRLTQAVLLFVDGAVDDRGDNLAEIEEVVSGLEQIVESGNV